MTLLPRQTLPVPLYWHCWNLASDVLDALTRAIVQAAARVLDPSAEPAAAR